MTEERESGIASASDALGDTEHPNLDLVIADDAGGIIGVYKSKNRKSADRAEEEFWRTLVTRQELAIAIDEVARDIAFNYVKANADAIISQITNQLVAALDARYGYEPPTTSE